MNMMERRKFRRKNRPDDSEPANGRDKAPIEAPIPPLESRDSRLARRRRDAEKAAKDHGVQEREQVDAAARARERAEHERRVANSRAEAERKAQAAAHASKAAAAQDARNAEMERARAEKQRRDEAARLEQQAQETLRLEAEALRQIEADRKRAEEARLLEDQRRADEALKAEAERKAQAAQQAQAAHEAEAERAEQARLAEEQRRTKPKPRPARPATLPLALSNPMGAPEPVMTWDQLGEIPIEQRHLDRNRVITASRQNPAHAAFDVLRTRLLQGLTEHGWTRVAITSPTKDCGKTFTAANLAISLSRQENCRTLLMDCDLRRPTLHKVLGVRNPGSMGDMLRGVLPPRDHLLRIGPNDIHVGRNIAFGFNGAVEPYASELLQDPRSADTLRAIEDSLKPDVMLFDLPPALYYDDVIAFRPLFDAVLLVIGGGITTEKEVREVERRLGDSTPLLGTILNKAEGTKSRKYSY